MDNTQTPTELPSPVVLSAIPIPEQPKEPNKNHWEKWLLIFLVICAILCGVVFFFVLSQQQSNHSTKLTPSPTRTPKLRPKPTASQEKVGQVYWKVPDGSVPSSLETELKIAFATYDPKLGDSHHLAVTKIQTSSASANFVVTNMILEDEKGEIIPTDGFAYYLHKKNSIWMITKTGDDDFCAVLKTFPEDLAGEQAKAYYIGCQ